MNDLTHSIFIWLIVFLFFSFLIILFTLLSGVINVQKSKTTDEPFVFWDIAALVLFSVTLLLLRFFSLFYYFFRELEEVTKLTKPNFPIQFIIRCSQGIILLIFCPIMLPYWTIFGIMLQVSGLDESYFEELNIVSYSMFTEGRLPNNRKNTNKSA